MTTTSNEPPKKPTLDELFAKIAPQRPTPLEKQLVYQRLNGKRKAHRFAVLYIKHNFSAREAFKQLVSEMGRKWTENSRKRAMMYANSLWVAHYVREIIQESVHQVQMESVDDLSQMMQINRLIIHGDICDLVEQVREFNPDGTYRLITRMKALSSLTRQERMLIKKIRFHRTGEVAAIEAYDRLDAQRTQLQLLDILKARGGSDQDWMADFRRRVGDARKQRIDIEVAAGKVIRLPSQRGQVL